MLYLVKNHVKRTAISTYTAVRWNSFFNIIDDLLYFKSHIIRYQEKTTTAPKVESIVFETCVGLEQLAKCVKDIV